ncbi:alkaline phosphatase family protein [Acidilobus sp.]|uniref:alkaline phosphatase family protein n=1 Tax=Acidilobus sp. TaxID=1872109 RepID=UPI003D062A74
MKLSLLGLDALSPALLSRAVERLGLKNIGDALRDGRPVPLRSMPPITPTAWTSMATGVNPAKHGVWGFTKYYRGPRGEHLSRPYTSLDVMFPRVFEDAALMGLDVAVVNYPLTWPLEGLCCLDRMTVVGDTFLAPRVDYSPRDLAGRLGRYFITFSDMPDPYERTRRLVEGTLELLSEVDADAYFVVLPYPDQAFHKDHREVLSVGPRSAEVWEAIDELAGELMRRSRAFVLASDHGAGVHGTCVNALAPLMREFGVGVPRDLRGRLALYLVTAADVISRALPPQLSPRGLSRRGPLARLRGRLGGELANIAVAATHESSGESELARQPFTYDAGGLSIDRVLYFRDEASRERGLRAMEGSPASRYLRVSRLEERFRGAYLPPYPSIFVESVDESRYHVVSSRSLAALRHDMMPDHEVYGVLLVKGAEVRADAAEVYDVAPTLLSLLGLKTPRGADGRSLVGGSAGEYPYDAAVRLKVRLRGRAS